MKLMKAVQLVKWESDPKLVEVAIPEPGPGSVLLRVDAAGLCRSDLHLMEWPEGTLPYRLPFTLGHEIAGTVAALGLGVEGLAEGERVVVYGPWGCEQCRECATGEMNLCQRALERGIGGGLGMDGGLAEYVLVPSARYLVPIGDLDPALAAPLTDAALSPYHAIRPELGALRPNAGVVVIGIGGLGHCAIQILRALTASRIVAVGRSEASLELARRLGAEATFSSDAPADDIRRELPGAAARLVLDFVGSDATVGLGAELLGTGGSVKVLGLGGGGFPLRFGSVPLEARAAMPSWGTLPELFDVVELAKVGELGTEVTRLKLEDAIDGYARLRDGEIVGRAVIDLASD